MVTKVCGRVCFTPQWFEGDCSEGSNWHTIECNSDTGEVLLNPAFRKKWLQAIKPVYDVYDVRHNTTNVSFLDFKSNPRRAHPFAQTLFHWYFTEVYSYARSLRDGSETRTIPTNVPVLVIKPSSIPWNRDWRNGVKEEDITKTALLVCRTSRWYSSLLVLQKWFRKTLCRRRLRNSTICETERPRLSSDIVLPALQFFDPSRTNALT